jgi:hypothetical protein
MLAAGRPTMSECKHGLKTGCSYCHVMNPVVPKQTGQKKRTRSSSTSEKMNDRMGALKKRLREIRGE